MAQYDDLTSEQQDSLDTWLQVLRPLAGMVARQLQQAQILDVAWEGDISAIVAALDAGALVPNKTGLAGAKPVTKEDLEISSTLIKTLLSAYSDAAIAQRQLRLAGINAVLP